MYNVKHFVSFANVTFFFLLQSYITRYTIRYARQRLEEITLHDIDS